MKRAGYLMEQVVDLDNLRLAYWKARKGKAGKSEIRSFVYYLGHNLLKIREDLLSGNFNYGNYHYFTIYEPKERQICAAPFSQRIVHHALMNVCDAYFENYQLYDSYACRKNKGTFAALQRAAYFNRKYAWYLKLDVCKYFDNVDHQILKNNLSRMFKDEALLSHFHKIIDSYSTVERKGLPIGNLTSQYFANYYLAYADHYVKEKLKVPAYVRYMDDMVLWSNDKKILKEQGFLFEKYCNDKLQLQLKPVIMNKNCYGLPFLGFIVHKNFIRLNSNSRRRFKMKVNKYMHDLDNNIISERDFSQNVQALYAFIDHAQSKSFSRNVISQSELGNRRLEPCKSGRQLEQQRQKLSCVESQQQRSRQQQQQSGLPPLPLAQKVTDGCRMIEPVAKAIPKRVNK